MFPARSPYGQGIIGALVLVLLGFGYWWVREQRTAELAELQRELGGFVVPKVEIDGTFYEVRNGMVLQDGAPAPASMRAQVLRIAHVSVLNRLDPILGLEGTSPELLAVAVQSLEQARSELVALHEEDARDLEGVLYPVAFLRLLAKAEAERQEVITEPSLRAARRYYQTALAATNEALHYIDRATRLYKTLPKDAEYYFLGGKSSPNAYVEALSRLHSDFSEKKERLGTRARCAVLFSTGCPTLPAALQALGRAAPRTTLRDAAVPSEIFAYEALLDTARTYIELNPETVLSKIVVQVPSSVCEAGVGGISHYGVRILRDAGGYSTIAFNNLDDIYFYDLSYEDHPYFKLLKENGTSYLHQPIENFYMCPDAGARYTELATLLALRDGLKSAPLMAPLGRAADLESHVTQAGVVTDADADAYLNTLAELLTQKGEVELANRMGIAWVLRLESLLAMGRAQSGYFEKLVDFVRTRNDYIMRSVIAGAPMSLQSVFVTRNPFLLLLLAYNKNAADEAPRLMEPVPFNSGVRRLVSYKDELRRTYSLKEAAALIIEGKQIETKMIMDARKTKGSSAR